MKYVFYLFCLFFTANTALGQHSITLNARQDTTMLYESPGYAGDPIRAGWTRKVEKQDSLWVLKLYDQKNALRESVSFADEKLEVRKGPYAFYENGNVVTEGNYDRGYKIGEWKNYAANKQLIEKANYAWDVFNGEYKSFYETGVLKREKIYAKGRLSSSLLYYPTGKLAYQLSYNELDELVAFKFYDEGGNPTTADKIIKKPRYPDGEEALINYLIRSVRYPPIAARNKIQGKVRLTFTVTKSGSLTNIIVKESPDPELSREAIRVVRKMKKWEPGTELGEPVESSVGFPVNFKLQN